MPLRPQPIISTRNPGMIISGTSINSGNDNNVAPVVSKGTIGGSKLNPINPVFGLPVIGRQNPSVPYVGNTPTNGGIVRSAPKQTTVYSSLVGGLFS